MLKPKRKYLLILIIIVIKKNQVLGDLIEKFNFVYYNIFSFSMIINYKYLEQIYIAGPARFGW